jgi:diguanylate cyclase (GGDEF)-like protein
MIDLDRFKSINDRFGHLVGDQVLQAFARTATANLRSSDLIGRLGGEEFAAVIADACRDNAFAVGERIRLAFAVAAAEVGGHAVNATTSVGISIIQDPSQDVTELLHQADEALYRAKSLGRDRVVVTGLGLPLEAEAPSIAPVAPQPAPATPARSASRAAA